MDNGTRARFRYEVFGVPQISTGGGLRAAAKVVRQLGLKAMPFIDAVELATDEWIIDFVKMRRQESDCKNGYCFDGFRSAQPKAGAMEHDWCCDRLPAQNRAAVRRNHHAHDRASHAPASGGACRVQINAPEAEMKVDVTGEALVHRKKRRCGASISMYTLRRQSSSPSSAATRAKRGEESPKAREFRAVSGRGTVGEIWERNFEVAKK